MAKAYLVLCYHSVSDEEALQEYAQLAIACFDAFLDQLAVNFDPTAAHFYEGNMDTASKDKDETFATLLRVISRA